MKKALWMSIFQALVVWLANAGICASGPLVDLSSIEICGNDGRVMITAPLAGDPKMQSVEAWSGGGSAKVNSIEVHELKSIYATK